MSDVTASVDANPTDVAPQVLVAPKFCVTELSVSVLVASVVAVSALLWAAILAVI